MNPQQFLEVRSLRGGDDRFETSQMDHLVAEGVREKKAFVNAFCYDHNNRAGANVLKASVFEETLQMFDRVKWLCCVSFCR